jgi:catechol 2,3-dioxygenase
MRQCRKPPPGASGSKTVSENDAVRAGGAVQRSGGEMFAPSHVYFFGIVLPEWNAGEASANAAASATSIAARTIRAVTQQAAAPPLPATLRLGPVHLAVRDLDRAIDWYERALGLRLHSRGEGTAELGDGADSVIVLEEDPEAIPAGRHAGLYHYALLYPSRAALARAALRLIKARTAIQGASDHGTHEAIYLPDADGNGIELAADRPREQWPTGLGYSGGPAPLDFEDLVATVSGEDPLEQVDDGLRVGHLHLHVGDIDEALAFYRDLVGFEEQANLGTAAFLSAGGYHHHLGVNVWKGRGVGPPPEHAVGLRNWTIVLPTADDVAEIRGRLDKAGVAVADRDDGVLVRDPWETAMVFTS